MTRSRWTAIGALAAVVVAGVVVAWAVGRPQHAMSPATPVPTATETATATAASATEPPATATASATASATPSAREAVRTAYLASWTVYARAARDLDPTELDTVMTGQMLQQTRTEIADLRKQGHAAQIVVEHHFIVAQLDPQAGTATVVDDYVNRSYLVDATTGQPIGTADPTPNTIHDTYYLVREDGQWKVSDGARTIVH